MTSDLTNTNRNNNNSNNNNDQNNFCDELNKKLTLNAVQSFPTFCI